MISDNIKPSEWPDIEELQLVGGLSLKEFDQLHKIGIISRDFSFIDDFRWTNKLIEEIVEKIDSHYKKLSMCNTTIEKLEKILKIASSKKMGLMAYCD